MFLVQYHPFQPLSLECRHSIRLETNRRQTSIDAFFCFFVLFILHLIFFAFFFHFYVISAICWMILWFPNVEIVFVFAAFLHYIFYHKNFCRICTNIRTHNEFRINFGKPNILTMWIFTFLSIFHKYLHSILRLDLSMLLLFSFQLLFSSDRMGLRNAHSFNEFHCDTYTIPMYQYFDKI